VCEDLVTKENVEKWLKYLRNELPTIPFKASTQQQSDRLVIPTFTFSICRDLIYPSCGRRYGTDPGISGAVQHWKKTSLVEKPTNPSLSGMWNRPNPICIRICSLTQVSNPFTGPK